MEFDNTGRGSCSPRVSALYKELIGPSCEAHRGLERLVSELFVLKYLRQRSTRPFEGCGDHPGPARLAGQL